MKPVFRLLVFSAIIFSLIFLFGCTSSSFCGDTICSANENSYTCEMDCGESSVPDTNTIIPIPDENIPIEISAQEICIDNDSQLGSAQQQSTNANFVIYSKSICSENETSSSCYETTTYVDKCTTGTTLQEQVCENDSPKTIEINCNCNEGKCE